MKLSLSKVIVQEWQSRCIGDVIPTLRDWRGSPTVVVDDKTAREIAEDCLWYADPKAVDATPGERAAYRGLLRQCQAAKATTP